MVTQPISQSAPLSAAGNTATAAALDYRAWLSSTNVVYITLVGIAGLLVLSLWEPTERFASKAAFCLLLLLLIAGGKK